ncbi:MAG TPA: hypothetical protein VK166_01880 [Chitinophagaceae bacterium]|nr:hypothetical protein [Chitinophagaceae bacterium]
MKYLISLGLILLCITSQAQKKYHLSFALTNNASSYPFQYLAGYVENPLHPGFELGYGKTWGRKKHHEWFGELKLGYFYHQFVQHGIPIYFNGGYRYMFNHRFSMDAALGAGYFHSIATTDVLKLENGEYVNAKGIGRPQIMAAVTLGAGYHIKMNKTDSLRLFLQYQARVQLPFNDDYVPVLPYNQIAIGVSIPIKK